MTTDIRAEAAKYYDLNPYVPQDVPFYRERIPAPDAQLYPELVYRQYEGEVLTDETVLRIAMRCYYPEEFAQLIRSHGFKSVARWGGYAGEPYEEGPELVIQFTHGT